MTRTDLSELFEQSHRRLVCSLLPMARNRDVAEDVAAAAFATALKKRHTFRGESAPATWLTAIGLNEARSWWRKEFRAISSASRFTKASRSSAAR